MYNLVGADLLEDARLSKGVDGRIFCWKT